MSARRAASIFYIEQPVGVGFSVADRSITYDEAQAAQDNLEVRAPASIQGTTMGTAVRSRPGSCRVDWSTHGSPAAPESRPAPRR